jgi:hypothetical protein
MQDPWETNVVDSIEAKPMRDEQDAAQSSELC